MKRSQSIFHYDKAAIADRLKQLGFPNTRRKEFELPACQKRKSGRTKDLKRRIFNHDFGGAHRIGKCKWCRDSLTFKEATIDHEPPLSIGGAWGCAYAACLECNLERGRELKKAIEKRNATII